MESVDDDPGIRKQCLDELDVLGIQVDNYGFHRSSFPVRVAVHEVLPDCLRQSVFKNSHDVMTSFSVFFYAKLLIYLTDNVRLSKSRVQG